MAHINAAAATGVLTALAERKLTIEDLVPLTNLSLGQLNARLSGQTAFRLPELQRIADALECHWSDLLRGTDAA